MQAVHDFLVKPVGDRYNNVSNSGLILNTELQNHSFVNRRAEVLSKPLLNSNGIEIGDHILIHHNVFRRFYDIRGKEKNSKAFFEENKYFCQLDQIYMVDKGNGWEALPGFTFIQPIVDERVLTKGKELPLWGIVTHPDKTQGSVKKDDIVSFEPSSEFEFVVENKKLYRIKSNEITVNNGRKGNETSYNSRWAESSGGIN